ncbi:DUF4907 domain-containing protein [Dinghuibacter silviterrae]|uniref:Uncharacterized protein DUF4907 n=1 Tax=Dinghuibacter silviterrae TaxID=1539049 RepID=A0A4R8DF02_9BACT|nr:DUF4907 domain-containing protein [Dinghuibacter silviterrae]TDW95987.1 uncharacterized protein DUF4907 [Dinghuibacter silviterrae]
MTITLNKKSWLSWALPLVGAALVIWYYTGTMPWTRHKGHEGEVWLECRPFEVTAGNGWGYNITQDGKLLIHQDRIPGVPGTRPFLSREDALKVGTLMISKMKKGLFPPGVSYQEMQGLGVTLN